MKTWADSAIAEMLLNQPTRPKTMAEIGRDSSLKNTLIAQKNAETLIGAGCVTTPSTDNYRAQAPEFMRVPRAEHQAPGTGSIFAIEGLVELGMTSAQAIVAATKNGALAMRMSDQLGTVETGKIADLVLLGADPLADIHNIRKLVAVFKDCRPVDFRALPTKPVFYRQVARPAP